MASSPRSTALKKPLQGALKSLQRTGKALQALKPGAIDPKKALRTLKSRHAARRKTSGMQLALADCVDALNPAHWDALAAQTVFLSRGYLRMLEAEGPDNIQPRYALAYLDGKPVAAMLFQRVAVSGDRLRKPGAKRLTDKPLAGLQQHLLVCGNLLVWGCRSVAFANGVDEAQLWHGVGEALYRLRRADKLLGESDVVMVKDFCADQIGTREALRLLGYRSVDTEPDMVLDIRPAWKTIDDYLASLTSGYRSNAKKLAKDCAAAGVTLRTVTADEMLARENELHALYEQVHMVQGLRLATLSPGYLPAMAQVLGERFVCRVAERDGQWLGFVTSVDDGDTALGYYIGYDRQANASAPIYLTLLQSTVGDAIAFGAKQLSLGRTALEPKAKLGCTPRPLACGVRHRVSGLNWMVSALTRTATHDEPPLRNPFKAP
jgi:hypothetical protein